MYRNLQFNLTWLNNGWIAGELSLRENLLGLSVGEGLPSSKTVHFPSAKPCILVIDPSAENIESMCSVRSQEENSPLSMCNKKGGEQDSERPIQPWTPKFVAMLTDGSLLARASWLRSPLYHSQYWQCRLLGWILLRSMWGGPSRAI